MLHKVKKSIEADKTKKQKLLVELLGRGANLWSMFWKKKWKFTKKSGSSGLQNDSCRKIRVIKLFPIA